MAVIMLTRTKSKINQSWASLATRTLGQSITSSLYTIWSVNLLGYCSCMRCSRYYPCRLDADILYTVFIGREPIMVSDAVLYIISSRWRPFGLTRRPRLLLGWVTTRKDRALWTRVSSSAQSKIFDRSPILANHTAVKINKAIMPRSHCMCRMGVMQQRKIVTKAAFTRLW